MMEAIVKVGTTVFGLILSEAQTEFIMGIMHMHVNDTFTVEFVVVHSAGQV